MNDIQTLLKPNEKGYITNWLVCGAKEQAYKTEYFNPNQLAWVKKGLVIWHGIIIRLETTGL